MKILIRIAALAALAIVSTTAEAQTPPTPARIRGTVEAVDGNTLTIKAREGGTAKVTLDDKTRLSVTIKASFADVKPGAYLGIAAVPQKEGPQKAASVIIFPEAARGTGEGHRGWDLAPESTMTNATLDQSVDSVDGRIVTMKYKGGETKIEIGKDLPIMTIRPGMRDELKAGTVVLVNGQVQADGTVAAGSVIMGKDGVDPLL